MFFIKDGESMKQSVGCGWLTRLFGMLLITMLALPAYAQLMLAHEGHHGAGGCAIETGEFPISFSAYEVPEGGIPPMHAFCDSIPNLGKVNLSIELVDRRTRDIPLAVRLVKVGHDDHGGHSEESESDATASAEAMSEDDDHDGHDAHSGHEEVEVRVGKHGLMYMPHGLVYLPIQTHNSGIISVVATIEEKGDYAVLLERHDDEGNVTVAARIPFNIGGGGHGGHGGGIGMLEIIILLILAGGGAYYYMNNKKAASDKS